MSEIGAKRVQHIIIIIIIMARSDQP